MSLLLIFALASAVDVRHGTDKECAAWYPDDWRKQLKCTEIVDPKVLAQAARYRDVCDDFAALAKGKGLVFVSANLKDGDKDISCKGFENFDPSTPE